MTVNIKFQVDCREGQTRSLSSSGLLRNVRWFDTDVSGLRIGPVFEGQAVYLTLRDIPEDGRLHFNSGGSAGSRKGKHIRYGCIVSTYHIIYLQHKTSTYWKVLNNPK